MENKQLEVDQVTLKLGIDDFQCLKHIVDVWWRDHSKNYGEDHPVTVFANEFRKIVKYQ